MNVFVKHLEKNVYFTKKCVTCTWKVNLLLIIITGYYHITIMDLCDTIITLSILLHITSLYWWIDWAMLQFCSKICTYFLWFIEFIILFKLNCYNFIQKAESLEVHSFFNVNKTKKQLQYRSNVTSRTCKWVDCECLNNHHFGE